MFFTNITLWFGRGVCPRSLDLGVSVIALEHRRAAGPPSWRVPRRTEMRGSSVESKAGVRKRFVMIL